MGLVDVPFVCQALFPAELFGFVFGGLLVLGPCSCWSFVVLLVSCGVFWCPVGGLVASAALALLPLCCSLVGGVLVVPCFGGWWIACGSMLCVVPFSLCWFM